MKNLLLIAVSIVALFSLSNCHKEIPKQKDSAAFCARCETCYYLPKNNSPFDRKIIMTPYQRKGPCFNPLNSDEFIYIKYTDSMYATSLVKYNLITKSETILINSVKVMEQPKWGANGWIIFQNLNLQIYKVKDNGDSLTQLTWIFGNTYPDVYGYDKFICSVNSASNVKYDGIKIIDLKGARLDSINYAALNGGFIFNAVNKIGEIAGTNYFNILTYNISEKTLKTILPNPSAPVRMISGICWHPNNEDIYFSSFSSVPDTLNPAGIYKINKNTKALQYIKSACTTRFYYYLSVSPDGNKILVERTNAKLLDSGTAELEADIYMMDSDGSNEHKVFP